MSRSDPPLPHRRGFTPLGHFFKKERPLSGEKGVLGLSLSLEPLKKLLVPQTAMVQLKVQGEIFCTNPFGGKNIHEGVNNSIGIYCYIGYVGEEVPLYNEF